MTDRYVLIGQTPVPEPDLFTWGRWLEEPENRIVEQRHVGPFWVSTVFLGLDHGWGGELRIFETMVFLGHASGDYQTRCATWTEAEQMHREAIRWIHSLWRRPFILGRMIGDSITSWMQFWDGEFYGRYGKSLMKELLADLDR